MDNAKKKFTDVKNRAIQIFEERPLETLTVLSLVAASGAKVIKSVTEARNAETWRREVKRREQQRYIR